jgi:hypothetical protein
MKDNQKKPEIEPSPGAPPIIPPSPEIKPQPPKIQPEHPSPEIKPSPNPDVKPFKEEA